MNAGQQKWRDNKYVPYNLKNFKDLQQNQVQQRRGGLGANIGTDQWMKKKIKTEK